jgi:regulation of enolase protein 1 (concanavalin A-like superfamily)
MPYRIKKLVTILIIVGVVLALHIAPAPSEPLLAVSQAASSASASAQQGQVDDPPVVDASANEVYYDPDTYAPIVEAGKPGLSEGVPVAEPVFAAQHRDEVSPAEAGQAPVIELFYGDEQSFGQIGRPQRWVNILGKVTSPSAISSLTFTLNGGPARLLKLGPDQRRLANTGDFNIEIDTAELTVGSNQVVVTAINNQAQASFKTVTVNYQSSTVWPTTYVADWSTTTNIQDLAQVVDGKWEIQDGHLRPVELGYDRLVAIGHTTWTDYEVTVPVTVTAIDEGGFAFPSNGPGIGLLMPWQGHFLQSNEQPTTGWQNFGGLGWYRWNRNDQGQVTSAVQLLGYAGRELGVKAKPLTFGTPYIFKMSVQTVPDKPSYYRFKMWPAADPEPGEWDVEKGGRVGEPPSGSFLLVAHHVDALFGPVSVRPLASLQFGITTSTDGNGTIVVTPPPTTTFSYGQVVRLDAVGNAGKTLDRWEGDISGNKNPYVLYITKDTNVTATFVDAPPPTITVSAVGNGTAVVIPQKELYDFGEQVTFLATPQVGYAFTGWSGSFGGLVNPRTMTVTRSLNVVANFGDAVPPLSDDFGGCVLDTNLWAFHNPVGDAQLQHGGGKLRITVPGSQDHDLWQESFGAARLTQPAVDADWGIEARFDSQPTERYQSQGIIIEQDENNFIRFDYNSTGSSVRAFAAVFENGLPTITKNTAITVPQDLEMYLLVGRNGNQWTAQYRSLDGVAWRTTARFDHEMSVRSVGVFAGNVQPDAATPPPAFTAVVDYFFQSNARIDPQDSRPLTPIIRVNGDGTVDRTPNKAGYDCDEPIQLTATPNEGSVFVGWSGAVSGRGNPTTMMLNQGSLVTATFAVGDFVLDTNVQGQGSLTRSPDKLAFEANEQVTLTATPAAGWRFVGWEGDATGSENPLIVTMDADKQIRPVFAQLKGESQLYLPLIQN